MIDERNSDGACVGDSAGNCEGYRQALGRIYSKVGKLSDEIYK
jgi:hypothetical protein